MWARPLGLPIPRFVRRLAAWWTRTDRTDRGRWVA
jgi:hypothetical protein